MKQERHRNHLQCTELTCYLLTWYYEMQAQCKTTDRHDYSDAHTIELKGTSCKLTTSRHICTSTSNKAATSSHKLNSITVTEGRVCSALNLLALKPTTEAMQDDSYCQTRSWNPVWCRLLLKQLSKCEVWKASAFHLPYILTIAVNPGRNFGDLRRSKALCAM